MSGGISAIKGFDYQATVILDRLFQHFDTHGLSALARPEGTDDLDLSWTSNEDEHRRYEQIKKPREDNYGNLKPASWTLSQAVAELFPNTIVNLSGNTYEQVWIVGDEIDGALRSLLSAGENAPSAASEPYWKTVHLLARNDAINAGNLDAAKRKELLRWRVPANLPTKSGDALASITRGFSDCAKNVGEEEVAIRFLRKATQLHECLPGILPRITIQSTYGSEEAVAKRVHDRLAVRYSLQYEVIENTLFRNLRGFINDISKQPGRKFNLEELEFELRSVWPQMTPIKDVPQLDAEHIERPDLVERFTAGWVGKAIEAIGISGSGKTQLAAEIAKQSRISAPDRQVYYAEVRPDVALRNVMAGVAFHLRRIGIREPFAISVENGPTDEMVLSSLARSYSAIPQEILLLVDLVEGACSPAFARDLATFVRGLTSSALRIAVFGQESALRELSQLEKDELGAGQVDIRGFRFEEFFKLVGHYHHKCDRAALWSIYQRVTAGRAAGLFAKLAQALASTQSLQEMSETASKPAEDALPYAEQQRFGRISPSARRAAEKLVCFALPFRRKDAEEIFSEDNVGAAIREMRTLGLLRPHDEDSYEMHETVRAGLEGTIALSVRHSAHQALAAWYGTHDLVTAEILHLEKAGKSNEAKKRARESFLSGERWAALSAYVIEHKLVSPGEIIRAIASPKLIEDSYFLSSVLRGLGEPVEVDAMLRTLREQPNRFVNDYQWALAIVEAILEFEPARLEDLIVFSVEVASDARVRESALTWLMIAARRKNCAIGPRTITFFGNQPPEIKKLLLRFLLLDRRRDALRCAFQFLASDQERSEGPRAIPLWSDVALQISNLADTVEFLAAVPNVKPAAMLVAKSALLGPLANLVWSQRKVLTKHCIEIIRDSSVDEKLVENAVRVLVFLAEPSICDLCDQLSTRKGGIRGFVALIPALVPAFCDRSRYQARLLDGNVALEDRVTALFILASVGTDVGDLYRRVKVAEDDPQRAQVLDFWFLTLSAQSPFAEAIPLLDKAMEAAEEGKAHLLISALTKLGELPVPAATALLVRALSHSNKGIRQCAAVSLSQRRANTALASLVAHYVDEADEVQAVTLATAIVASGARSVMDLQSASHDAAATQLWQCILVMRSRDATFADRLVTLACDPTQNWQLRRVAIFAAGRLPYEGALERIAPLVLAERSPLTIDQNASFLCHAVMSSILLSGIQGLAPIFARGRVEFIELFAEIFEASWSESISRQDLLTGAEAAGWLFDRLSYHGWPGRREAADIVLNELNIPMLHSAVLRSLRLSGKPEVIEEQLPRSYHVWFSMKCLMERARIEKSDPALASRLKALVDASPCLGNALLDRVINEICGRDAKPFVAKPVDAGLAVAEPAVSSISYATAERALSDTKTDLKLVSPVVLETLTQEQFEQLTRLADPANDQHEVSETFIPSVQFTRDGHIVAQRRTTYTANSDSVGALIRPAIAAASVFGLTIPWHQELLIGPLANTYVPKFLMCLGARNDSDRFYEELTRNADVLLPYICNSVQGKSVSHYVDARIIPFLSRYLSSGTDELLEGLCALALHINSSEIDNVLAALFYRWTQRFDMTSRVPQHDHNYPLWRAFKRLSEHPRFNVIEGWRTRLAVVLSVPISWIHSQDIVRVLERDPRSYVLIETRLFRAENWEHFHQDEIDRLDDAAERLFPQLLEN